MLAIMAALKLTKNRKRTEENCSLYLFTPEKAVQTEEIKSEEYESIF